MAELGYPGARASLKDDAVPDIPMPEDGTDNSEPTPKKTRGAYEKRRRQELRPNGIYLGMFSESGDLGIF